MNFLLSQTFARYTYISTKKTASLLPKKCRRVLPMANFLTPASNQYNKQMPLQANNLKTLIKSPNYVYRYYRCTVFICDIDYLLAENQAPIRHAHLIANYRCPTGWYVR